MKREKLHGIQKNKVIRIFMAFLKSHNIRQNYVNNVLDYITTLGIRSDAFRLMHAFNTNDIKNMKPHTFIDYAFHWASTKEGGDFWYEKNVEWLRSFCGVNENDAFYLLGVDKRLLVKYEQRKIV